VGEGVDPGKGTPMLYIYPPTNFFPKQKKLPTTGSRYLLVADKAGKIWLYRVVAESLKTLGSAKVA